MRLIISPYITEGSSRFYSIMNNMRFVFVLREAVNIAFLENKHCDYKACARYYLWLIWITENEVI